MASRKGKFLKPSHESLLINESKVIRGGRSVHIPGLVDNLGELPLSTVKMTLRLMYHHSCMGPLLSSELYVY